MQELHEKLMRTAMSYSMLRRDTYKDYYLSNEHRIVLRRLFIEHVPVYFERTVCDRIFRVPVDDPTDIPIYIYSGRDDPTELFEPIIAGRDAMREYFLAAPTMPDPLPDPPCTVLIDDFIGIHDDKLMCGVRNAVTRNRKLRETVDELATPHYYDSDLCNDSVCKYLCALVDLSIRVPLHVVNNTIELGKRNLLGTVYVMYPHYTTCATMVTPEELDECEFDMTVRVASNDFLSLLSVSTSVAYDFPQRTTKLCVPAHRSAHKYYVVIPLDLDTIADVLDRDGWTSEMQQFAREQLKIDAYHNYAFGKFLRARKDTPIGIM